MSSMNSTTITSLEPLINPLSIGFHILLITVSPWTILVYDYVITIDQEIEHIWKQPGRGYLGTALFLVTRYLTLASAIPYSLNLNHKTPFNCSNWRHFQQLWSLFLLVIIEFTLQIRVFALYKRSKSILLLISVAFFGCIGVAAAFTAKELTSTIDIVVQLFTTHGCYVTKWTPYCIFFAAILVDEIILFCLVLKKFMDFSKDDSQSRGNFPGRSKVSSLILDSMLYFCVIFAVDSMALFIWLFLYNYSDPALLFAVFTSSIASQRILLNLRQVFYGGSASY